MYLCNEQNLTFTMIARFENFINPYKATLFCFIANCFMGYRGRNIYEFCELLGISSCKYVITKLPQCLDVFGFNILLNIIQYLYMFSYVLTPRTNLYNLHHSSYIHTSSSTLGETPI